METSAAAPTASTQQLAVQLLDVTRTSVDLESVLRRVADSPCVQPFHESRTEFLADFARDLGKRARGQGEVQALAYWLRRSELKRMEQSFAALASPTSTLMPRGMVFHVPPANVGTIFVYSLSLALVTGNNNIIRMSSRALSGPNLVLDVLRDALARHPEVARSVALISYGHDNAITDSLSLNCDVRVVWGGDATVGRVRQSPLQPHAKDVTFADRFSLAAIATGAYEQLAAPERDHLVERFFNDTFWFDQLGCSSPRALIWVGPEAHGAAATDFHERLAAVVAAKGYRTDISVEVAKLNEAYRSVLDLDVGGYHRYGDVETVLDTAGFPSARGEFCGGGLLYQWQVNSINQLVPHIRRKDQTLATFGLASADLRDFVRKLAGRGIDRIVPFGAALNFGRYWDGYDLLSEFTRRVAIEIEE